MQQETYKRYLLILLMVILAFNYVDRVAVGLLMQSIKTDLQLTDSQLGLLSGIAFALFYAVMGVPIARWADRGNRVAIISLTAGLWSAAVILCGTVTSFVQLLIVRVGVAVGEAGAVPPAHSLIADVFTRSERPRAVSRYMLGVPLAVIIGYFAAGWLNEFYGWRITFVVVGMPGLFLAMLAWLTLRDPRLLAVPTARTLRRAPISSSYVEAQASMKEVIATLWRSTTFRHLLFCFSVWSFFGDGLQQWTPAFFVRSHHLATGELGTWFAAMIGCSGLLGIYLGGEWATRYASGNERLQLVACAIAFLFYAVLYTCAFLSPNIYLSFAAMGLANLGGNMAQGPILATIQTLVPQRMRAMSISILYFFAHLIGMGFGPLAVGMLSDEFRPMLGNESLRYALICLCPGYIWAAWHLWRAGATIYQDIQPAHSDDIVEDCPPEALQSNLVVGKR
jgi:MFS family permease